MSTGVLSGSYTPTITGSDPTRQVQMTSSSITSSMTGISQQLRVQDYASFTLTFQISTDNASADSSNIFFGNTSAIMNPSSSFAAPACGFNFEIWSGSTQGQGIHFYDTTATRRVTNSTTASKVWVNTSATVGSGTWYSVQIVYNRSPNNTWAISIGTSGAPTTPSLLYTYSDPNHTAFLSASGSYWGVASMGYGASTNQYFRNIKLVTYGSPVQTLFNFFNWYSLLTIAGVATQPAGSQYDPYIQAEMIPGTATNQTGYYYSSAVPVGKYSYMSFECGAWYVGSTPANGWFFIFGSSSSGATLTSGSVAVYFNYNSSFSSGSYSGAGVYIIKSGTAVAYSSTGLSGISASTWTSLQIIYNYQATNTWVVYVSGSAVLTWSDSSYATTATGMGTYFNAVAQCGSTQTMQVWFDRLSLIFTPRTFSFSQLRTAAPGVSSSGAVKLSQFYGGQAAALCGLNNTGSFSTSVTWGSSPGDEGFYARDLGAWNMSPWLLTSSQMPDSSARWLWNTTSAATSASNYVIINFIVSYSNTSTSNVSATLYAIVDDASLIYQNKILVGSTKWYYGAQYTKIAVTLVPGLNVFEFLCWNSTGSTAGLIFSCINTSSTVLFRSDNYSPDTVLTNSTRTIYSVVASPSSFTSNIPQQPAPVSEMCILDQVSSTAKSNCSGAYALFLLTTTYTGPVINIMRSSDSTSSDVYADMGGNLFIDSAHQSPYSTWISTATAYVTKWYDQSGNGNHCTQTTTGAQPVMYLTNSTAYGFYSVNSSCCVCSGSRGWGTLSYLNMPSGVIPTGTSNAAYSFCNVHYWDVGARRGGRGYKTRQDGAEQGGARLL
ncbi:uncharacterized protein BJ171DRAFT_608339 [Polychytrium aggregatum]|uniref:uncharacterized protein n=1 Tax=Polychytrium aggregatum TaxID=110093 RepID=UPI0022FE67FE|nr:uncharacterized protein BJ171DRAFT_608339 [Polychytrium aggregatum]KAI9183761.1 hypothetical protein BJ171DRAFT_608339 [Polychytrium aggregatum]